MTSCHLFTYSQKMVPVTSVTKLCDNRIFEAFMPIKKSVKSIDFDLAKQVLVFNHRWDLFEYSKS